MSTDKVLAAIRDLLQRVAEYDGRTSPDDAPDLLLITSDELAAELWLFADELLGPQQPAAEPAQSADAS